MYNIDSSQRERMKGEWPMTREQILEKLDKVETALFLNDMIDHWTWADREERARLEKEKRELLAMLEG